MSDNYPGHQPPCGTKKHWLAEFFSVEPGADPTCPNEHVCSELLQTICDLAFNSHGSWSGLSEEILAAANARNRLVGITPKQINLGVLALQERFEIEGIKHLLIGNISGKGLRHVFLVLP